MITRAMIKAEKENWKIGQDIVVQIFHIMSEGGRKQAPCFRKFKVLAKTDRMLIVGNGKYKVSVDLIGEMGSSWSVDPAEGQLRYKYAYTDGVYDMRNNLIKHFEKEEENGERKDSERE